MPRLKKSPGKRSFRSPIMPELQRLLFYELANHKQWNAKSTVHIPFSNGAWEFKSYTFGDKDRQAMKNWTIHYNGIDIITVISDEPKVWIRQGFYINMGHGRIEIECHE